MLSSEGTSSVVRMLLESLAKRDAMAVEAVLAEDVVWHFPGQTGLLAGDHFGRQAVFEFLFKVVELTGDTFDLEVIDVLASEDRAAVLFRGHAKRSGRTLDNPTCLVLSIHNGTVTELWEYVWDLSHVEEFWK